MKKKTIMGKIGVITLTFALSMAMLTGCGGDTNRNSDEVTTENAADSAGMVHLESTEEVNAFMDEVYAGVAQELLPMNVETTELDLNDVDMIEYHTGLVNLTGIEGIYLSESMISSVAYSAVYIRTNEEADASVLRQMLMDNINPSKWVCVTAQKEYAVILGNDIFFVMGAQDTAKAVVDQAIAAAQSRNMNVSDTMEKENSF
ncbi:MAG: hypothetical protein II247_05120 [Lachnospiraceae bacterium]|nr:hypothetical protein [Lachnospiraceae bacterium]